MFHSKANFFKLFSNPMLEKLHTYVTTSNLATTLGFCKVWFLLVILHEPKPDFHPLLMSCWTHSPLLPGQMPRQKLFFKPSYYFSSRRWKKKALKASVLILHASPQTHWSFDAVKTSLPHHYITISEFQILLKKSVWILQSVQTIGRDRPLIIYFSLQEVCKSLTFKVLFIWFTWK